MKDLDFRPVDGSTIKFRFGEFNARRKARGVEAVRMYIDEGEGEYWLWMSEKHIKANIKEFGEDPELLKALKHYTTI